MQVSASMIRSAAKAKAPIVAIPVPGRVPVCLNRKILAAWSKGVTITSASVITLPDVERFELPAREYVKDADGVWGHVQPEGPARRIVTPGETRLWIAGHSSASQCSCTLIPIPRSQAIRELSKWSEKERERQQKRVLLGALDATTRKELKRARFDGVADTITTAFRPTDKGDVQFRQGVPVAIPEMPDAQFVIVRLGDDDYPSWSVTEVRSGLGAGYGKTAEAAIVQARQRVRDGGEAGLASARKRIAEMLVVPAAAQGVRPQAV